MVNLSMEKLIKKENFFNLRTKHYMRVRGPMENLLMEI